MPMLYIVHNVQLYIILLYCIECTLYFAVYIHARLAAGPNEHENRTPDSILFQSMEKLCGQVFTYNIISIKNIEIFSPCTSFQFFLKKGLYFLA